MSQAESTERHAIRHIVTWKRGETVTQAEHTALLESLGELLTSLGQAVTYSFAENLRLTRDDFDYALVADFADEASFLAYHHHELHDRFRQRFIGSVMVDVRAGQIALTRLGCVG